MSSSPFRWWGSSGASRPFAHSCSRCFCSPSCSLRCRKRPAAALRALLGVPVIMALWVNLHGGWLVGLGTLAIWLALVLVEPDQDFRRRAVFCGAGLAAALATLANPYGVQMWSFVRETVRLRRPDIMEWAPISTIPLGAATPWIVSVTAAAFVLVRSPLALRPRDLAVIAMLAVAAFRVNRLDAFLAIAVVVLLAPEFARRWPEHPSHPRNTLSAPDRRTAIAVTLIAAAVVSLRLAGRSPEADVPPTQP